MQLSQCILLSPSNRYENLNFILIGGESNEGFFQTAVFQQLWKESSVL